MNIALIQARMGSSRLPEKTLANIAGKPMLWHLIKRVEKAKSIDKIVIATTVEPQDDAIEAFAKEHNIAYYRGSEMDIMSRLTEATEANHGSVAVRITGDCPLVDPRIIDKLVTAYTQEKEQVDIVTNIFPPSSPDGLSVEVVPLSILKRALQETQDPMWREWATVYFYEHPQNYRIKNILSEPNLSHHRWTVDYQEDLKLITAIFEALGPNGEDFTTEQILDFLEKNPEIYMLNRKYKRNQAFKKLAEEKGMESDWAKTQS